MADMGDGRLLEFVEACQPPYGRAERWILMVSTLYGCPVRCLMCDAGGDYRGKPSAEEILAQIEYMVRAWFPDGHIPATKFKIQFARMGEPSFNPAVLEALEQLPRRLDAPGLMPSLSTIAPHGTDKFFAGLTEIKQRLYPQGRFQLQFSIHTTEHESRERLMPVRKWSFEKMAAYGQGFWQPGDRKITLNFALARGLPADPDVLLRHFDPDRYLIKVTPLNPTCHATENGLRSLIDPERPEEARAVIENLSRAGYEVIVSIGEVEENLIGSNCGQYVLKYLESGQNVEAGYSYEVLPV
jgi:23S rRNA (adenine2503-C2)-methyltransferase